MMKSIMKSELSIFVIPSLLLLLLLCIPLQAVGAGDPVSCDEKTVVASAVRTADDIQAFVQCAYELVQDVGFAEAYRAFHEDARWRSGPITRPICLYCPPLPTPKGKGYRGEH